MNSEFYRDLVKRHEKEILAAEQWFWTHPEPGYREWNTAKYLGDALEKAGYRLTRADGIPGFYAELDTGRPGPTVAILGELDALPVPAHPEAVNGVVHACGHHLQISALLGAALALKEPGAVDSLCGRIRLMAVPAEESLELSFRDRLSEMGIANASGKVEFMYRGMFDGVDIALMNHSTVITDKTLCIYGNSGVMSCRFTVTGKTCHSSRPERGINAVNAAALGIQAVNALRETFPPDSGLCVNNLLDTPNGYGGAISEKAIVLTMIRARKMKDILWAREKIARAFAAAAAVVGAKVQLEVIGMNMPHVVDDNFRTVAREAYGALVGEENVDILHPDSPGGTDCGDVSSVIPMLQGRIACACGAAHGTDYHIGDKYTGAVVNAAAEVCLAAALLENGAEKAKTVMENYKPEFRSYADYFAAKKKIMTRQPLVSYREDGTAELLPCASVSSKNEKEG